VLALALLQVSCDKGDDNDGCNGGFPYKAAEWVSKHGIDTEEAYPYTSGGGTDGQCRRPAQPSAVNVTGHVSAGATEEAIAAFVAKNGPVMINVDAMTQLWWPYR
jgi:hypothetical protein